MYIQFNIATMNFPKTTTMRDFLAPQDHIVIRTRDVDGNTSKRFKSLKGAVKRFEKMLGYSVAAAIAAHFHASEKPPAGAEQLVYVRGVSGFGTVVTWEAVGAAKERAIAARAPAATAAT